MPVFLFLKHNADAGQGQPVGTPDEEGEYPAGTVYGAVQQKLKGYMKQALRLKRQLGGIY